MCNEKDLVEITVHLEEATLNRIRWVAEHSCTDESTVVRVLLANHVYQPEESTT